MHSTSRRNDHESPPIRQLLSNTDEFHYPPGENAHYLRSVCLITTASCGLRSHPLTCMLLRCV